MAKTLLERDIRRYLVKRVKELGGEARKVAWENRPNAPDWVVMLPAVYVSGVKYLPFARQVYPAQTIWLELKNPETVKTFPADAHERAQAREHRRMRAVGQRVEVVGTYEQVDALLS